MKNSLIPVKFLACFCFLATLGCQKTNSIIMVQVSDTHVLKKQEYLKLLSQTLVFYPKSYSQNPQNLRFLQDQVTSNYIKNSLLQRWAQKKNIFISTENLAQEISRIQSQYPTRLVFLESLKKNKIGFKEWKKKMRFLLLEKRLRKSLEEKIPNPSPQDIASFYKKNKSRFKLPRRAEIQKVDFPSLQKAQRAKRRLRGQKKFFLQILSQYPNSTFWIQKPSPFEQALSMRVGQISSVIKSSLGFHMFQVLRKKNARTQTLSETRERISKLLKNEPLQKAYSLWLEKEIRTTSIFKNTQALEGLEIKLK